MVVIYRATVGHPCCGEPNCKVPLANNHDQFCPTHAHLNQICTIVHCSLPVVPGRKTCTLANHEAIETGHNDCGQAHFQLKEHFHHAQLAHPHDALPVEVSNVSKLVDNDNSKEYFGFNGQGQSIPVEEHTYNMQEASCPVQLQMDSQ